MNVDKRVNDLDELNEKGQEKKKGTRSNTGSWKADKGDKVIWFVWNNLEGDNFIIRWLLASEDEIALETGEIL
jgi:hypothetical protein